MMKKRFSTKLLAFLVAAVTVIPTTAFAADAADQTAKQGIDPAVLFNQALEGGPAPTLEGKGVDGALEQPTKEGAANPVDPAAPATPKDAEQQPEGSTTPVDPVKPDVPDAGGETGTEVPPANPAPEAPAVPTPEIPAVPVPEEPTPVATEPAIIVEEATPAAIEVVPVAATLTITHRLVVGDQKEDMVQTIEGIEVGQIVNLAEYVVTAENLVCISNPSQITIDEENDTAVIEYSIIEEPSIPNKPDEI